MTNKIKKIRHIALRLFTVFSILLLTACMSAPERYDRDYFLAKQSFAVQNYRDAFVRLQAPAHAGNPDAQYALGFLYYTGNGTLQNDSLAKYWFEAAAAQGQSKAKEALAKLQSSH